MPVYQSFSRKYRRSFGSLTEWTPICIKLVSNWQLYTQELNCKNQLLIIDNSQGSPQLLITTIGDFRIRCRPKIYFKKMQIYENINILRLKIWTTHKTNVQVSWSTDHEKSSIYASSLSTWRKTLEQHSNTWLLSLFRKSSLWFLTYWISFYSFTLFLQGWGGGLCMGS